MKEKSKVRLKTLLKIIVSLSLILYIIYTFGPYNIIYQIQEVNLFYFFIVILITVFNVMISARKWQLLLKAKDEIQSFFHIWKLYYIGTFFNMFLPTNVGGDVVKAHKLSRVSKKSVEAYSSVFMERFTGLIAVIVLATISTTFYLEEIPRNITYMIYGVFLPAILVAFFLISSKRFIVVLQIFLKKIFNSFNPFSLKEKSIKILKSVNHYTKKKKSIVYAIFLSLIFHTLLIMSNYILGLSLGLDISLYYFFIFIPISHILLFLPVSIRGLGVREVIYVYFFTQVGATGAQAVSLSLLVQLIGVISSLIGGLVYLSSKVKKVKEVEET